MSATPRGAPTGLASLAAHYGINSGPITNTTDDQEDAELGAVDIKGVVDIKQVWSFGLEKGSARRFR
jgi:hypothetical protein